MIGWRDGEGTAHRGSLFATFAALARGEAWSFPALRPHQREPWHAFTVQVAALALIRAETEELPSDEAGWRELLLALTPDCPEAWELVVDDWSKPALLQPPLISPENRSEYKTAIHTPDALDMLVTSKNHDVKAEQIMEASEEDWLFALVTLQTASAYGGAKTYGASRMNGKTGSRLIARVKPEGGSAAGFQRDVRLLASSAKPEANLKALVWLEPTDGREPIGYDTLAPTLYIDCARRVRLCQRGSRIAAAYATSERARINADVSAGVTGDPYAPIKPERDASITPKRPTFGYRGIAGLLKADLPILTRVQKDDAADGLSISFSALVRKGGTDTNTEGFFQRTVRTSRMEELVEYGPAEALDRIGGAAAKRAAEASDAGRRLRRSLILLVQGGPDQARLDDDAAIKKIEPWMRRFDTCVDHEFFQGAGLWDEALTPDLERHRRLWRTRLRELATKVFTEATQAAPRTQMRRVRAIARARTMLDAEMAKWFKEISDGQ